MSKGLLYWAATLGLALACSTQPKAIQVQPGQATTPPGAGGYGPGGQQGGGLPSGTVTAPGHDAEFTASLDARVADYVGSNFHYQITYAGQTIDGEAQVNGSSATIKQSAMPSGQTADLTLKLFQQGQSKPALSGTTKNVKLNPGTNSPVSITLYPLDANGQPVTTGGGITTGGGTPPGTGGTVTPPGTGGTATGNNADLQIQVNIANGGTPGTIVTPPGGTVTPPAGTVVNNPPVGGAATYASIAASVQQYCVKCHGVAPFIASQESEWQKIGKATMTRRLTGTGASLMPTDTTLPPDVKSAMLNYVNTLN